MRNAVRSTSLALVGLVTLGLASANAQVTTPLGMVMTEALDTDPARTDWTKTISIPKFDSSLGTLVGVCIGSKIEFHSFGMLTNKSNGPEDFKYGVSIDASLKGGGVTQNTSTAKDTGLMTLDAGQKVSFDFTGSDEKGLTNYTDAAILAAFTGTGNLDFTGKTITGTTFAGGGGNIDPDQDTFAKMTVQYQYKYRPTDVPEPGTVALIGAGLTGSIFLLRRRK